jgi:FkbH-like protein
VVEPIRLVVWDLDGVFWSGILTEGGHTYSHSNHHIVIELARRGIVSSICSKNDHDTVKAILQARGIWGYFVFPSIEWTPKGPRLKRMIEDVQLRPQTVLLLDDNLLNLNEARHFVPDIQTEDEGFIPRLIDSPLCQGKDDRELTRLKQYKLLESRSADQAVSDDNIEFLRASKITVAIDADVEKNVDRAIELINRTNQLNFTKERLPDEPAAAREALLEQVRSYSMQAGLVRVSDRYGDYGFCGFYLLKTSRGGRTKLRHFCFSCRILNMGVENWLYERLGRPRLDVVGEVLTDLRSSWYVDWINVGGRSGEGSETATKQQGRVLIRGACTVSPLSHYFQLTAREVIGEFYQIKDYVQIRRDHSLMLRYGIEGRTSEQRDIFDKLGIHDEDFQTAFADSSEEPMLRVLCNWADFHAILYRHKFTGLLVPYRIKRLGKKNNRIDPVSLSEGDGRLEKLSETARQSMRYLRENFDFVGGMPKSVAARTWDVIFDALPAGNPLFIVAAPEDGMPEKWLAATNEVNRWMRSAIARHPSKLIFPLTLEQIAREGERQSAQHFDRTVHFRLYEEIWRRYQAAISMPSPTLQESNLGGPSAASVFSRVLSFLKGRPNRSNRFPHPRQGSSLV